MKKMKKMLAAVLTGGMILSLAACGSGGEDSGESKGEKKDSDIKVGFVVSDMSDASKCASVYRYGCRTRRKRKGRGKRIILSYENHHSGYC